MKKNETEVRFIFNLSGLYFIKDDSGVVTGEERSSMSNIIPTNGKEMVLFVDELVAENLTPGM